MKLAVSFYHYFLPHESNNFKARVLQPFFLIVILSFVISLQIILRLLPASGVKILGYAAYISPEEIVRLTNEERVKHGLEALKMNTVLSQAALAKGTDMLNKDYWAHTAPDGTEPWKFFLDFGYRYRFAGENLARDFSNPADVVSAWMASPTHKENILSDKYQEIGVAVVEGDMGGVDTTLVVQLFGTKLSEAPRIAPIAAAKGEEKSLSTPLVVEEPETQVSYQAPIEVVRVSPFNISKIISLGLTLFLVTLLVVDFVVVARQKVRRVGGRVFAHLAFLGMILAILIIAKEGNIL